MNIVRSFHLNNHSIPDNFSQQNTNLDNQKLVDKSQAVGQEILNFTIQNCPGDYLSLSESNHLVKGFEAGQSQLVTDVETGDGDYILVAEGEDFHENQMPIEEEMEVDEDGDQNDPGGMTGVESAKNDSIIGIENFRQVKEKFINLFNFQGTENKIKKLKGLLNPLLGNQKYQWLIEFIKQSGSYYLIQVQLNGRGHVEIEENNQVLFTLSGKIFTFVNELGRGRAKITSRIVLIGHSNIEEISKNPLKMRACSLSQADVSIIENQNEMQMNSHLKKQSKIHDLSNVNVMKSAHLLDDNRLAIIMEIYDGNIDELLEERYLTEKERLMIAAQMIQAVLQLHLIDVLHRDIKPDNFLFQYDHQNRVKFVRITDFGNSSLIEMSKRTNMNKLFVAWSDPAWFDPELKKEFPDARFSKCADIYQLGITVCQTLIGYSINRWKILQEQDLPMFARDCQDLASKDPMASWKKNPDLWTGLGLIKDPYIRNMVRLMVDHNPNKRPLIEQVNTFFQQKNREAEAFNP